MIDDVSKQMTKFIDFLLWISFKNSSKFGRYFLLWLYPLKPRANLVICFDTSSIKSILLYLYLDFLLWISLYILTRRSYLLWFILLWVSFKNMRRSVFSTFRPLNHLINASILIYLLSSHFVDFLLWISFKNFRWSVRFFNLSTS